MFRRFFILIAISLVITVDQSASAHLIKENHAQLTFRDKGAYFMASYPVQAFRGFDDDKDGLMSAKELSQHEVELKRQVLNAVNLSELKDEGPPQKAELEGLLLNLSHRHHRHVGADHLIVIGRFKTGVRGKKHFRSALFSHEAPRPLKLRVSHHGLHLLRELTHTSMSVELNPIE